MTRSMKPQRSNKREAILASAEDLFTRFGANRVTIEEICRVAVVSKMTFYKNFRNKADLVRNIHDDLVARSFAMFDEISAKQISFTEKIDLMGQWKQQFMSRLNVGFFRELIDIEHSVEELKRRYLRNITDAQKTGDVRADINPEFLWLILETVSGLFKNDDWRKVCPDLGDAQRQLRTILWHGLLVRERAQTDNHIEKKGGASC